MVFVCSGSEAVESCLKVALQYQQAVGQGTRTRFIARDRSYVKKNFFFPIFFCFFAVFLFIQSGTIYDFHGVAIQWNA